MNLAEINRAIIQDPENKCFQKMKWKPIYSAHPLARILIIGQAPGRLAQESGIPWKDLSGNNLREWLGVTNEEFYDPKKIALVPMDFYYPGGKERGDRPPREGFSKKWHPLILKEMPRIKLTILIGQYSQAFYLESRCKPTLTETVRAFREYLPHYLPLVHPSPRNNIWQKKNPWFKKQTLMVLRKLARELL